MCSVVEEQEWAGSFSCWVRMLWGSPSCCVLFFSMSFFIYIIFLYFSHFSPSSSSTTHFICSYIITSLPKFLLFILLITICKFYSVVVYHKCIALPQCIFTCNVNSLFSSHHLYYFLSLSLTRTIIMRIHFLHLLSLLSLSHNSQ